jgi:alpha-N-arabinofuranosidase
MPADNIKGMRRDTLELLKELDAPMYRWPGGCFVGGYDWRDGLGDPDRRPTRKNPAWGGYEYNDFGVHEFIDFCEYLGTEPFVAIDDGVGSIELAADEVEYFNGSADTIMGKLRAKNGHPEPWRVKWWAVGNEMFGKWQNGYVPRDQYVVRHNKYAEAMWEVDPSIKLIAVGAVDANDWSRHMMLNCADYMDYISEHFYIKLHEVPRYRNMTVTEHVAAVPNRIRTIADEHRRFRRTMDTLKGKDIQIAMDEWNYYSGVPFAYGDLGIRYYLKDVLGISAGLHEFFRQSDIIYIANYARTVNVLGCIKTNRTHAAFATTGLPLKMYRRHFGVTPVEVSGAPQPLDVAAAWTEARDALTIAIVNPAEKMYVFDLDLKNARLTGDGQVWRIRHSDPMAYNEPGKPPQVVIEEDLVSSISDGLDVEPLSINLYRLTVQ